MVDEYTASPNDGGLPPIALAALREQLHTGDSPYTHVLFLGAEAAAGETISKKSLWPWSNRLTFLGGVQLSHVLVELASGHVVSATSESLLAELRIKLSSGEAQPIGPIKVQVGAAGE
jgi:hypothetical protein